MTLGKRTIKAREGVDREKLYPLQDAVKMVKERAKAKFDETIEIAMNLGVDPRHAGGAGIRAGGEALADDGGRTTEDRQEIDTDYIRRLSSVIRHPTWKVRRSPAVKIRTTNRSKVWRRK